ncbi:alpha/beta hydrolase [Bacteroides sp. 519]|uniref:alpha/beta hydrolase n=1 Tax=Bacteroides sp. 519 TaxID=2302937 RepID=UPI0013D3E782|nr:alpha/beta hydrolase [Bacteroides sp. 519]NDV60179.1 alpha/beta hydrolase [Bacteroides sp. 519]
MRKVLFALMMCIAVNVGAQTEVPLWPDGLPNSNGLADSEQQPILTVYKSAQANSPTIIICPGGGYSHLAMNHEGHDMAAWFNAQGITYIILKYRMPNGNYEVPLSDAEQAIRIARKNAEAWNINPNKVGIMGASAGGHLASTLATHYSSKETRPDFQILMYPVITMDKGYTHQGSRNNLLGENPTEELVKKFSNELQVTPETPKAFIIFSSNDGAVPVANGVNYYMALVKNNVSAAFHTYPIGGHGWGFRDNFIYKRQWTGELEKWLREEIIN